MKLARLQGRPEIFHSIQGEGVTIGLPSVFIRLSQCNLHCQWCDTDYTWNWIGTPWTHQNDARHDYQKFGKSDYIEELPASEVAELALAYQCPNFILTGGEPLLQREELSILIEKIRNQMPSARFEIETNGTRDPGPVLWDAIDQFNVSPKLANSNNEEKLRIVPDVLTAFAESPKAWFKFVVKSAEDLVEINSLEEQFSLPRSRTILMPEGTSSEALQQRQLWLADQCRKYGYRLGDRLHVKLWGAKRGV